MTWSALAAAAQIVAATFTAPDGAAVHIDTIGRGDPVVVLAGGPGFTPRYMSTFCDWIARTRQCVLLHQRGTGRSIEAAQAPGAITLGTFVADIEALRVKLAQDRLTLVGHSWGGMLAMAYAAAHPNRVRALVLLASGGPTLDYMAAYDRNAQARTTAEDRRMAAYWQTEAAREGNTDRVLDGAMTVELAPVFADRSKVPALVALLGRAPFNREAFTAMLSDLRRTGYDLRPALAALGAPTLLVQGRQDPIATIGELARLMPGAVVVHVEQAGHYLWFEQPAAVFGAIDAFLRAPTRRP